MLRAEEHLLESDPGGDWIDRIGAFTRGTFPELIGFISVDPKDGLVATLGVLPEARERGIGRSLIEIAKQMARDKGAPAIQLLSLTGPGTPAWAFSTSTSAFSAIPTVRRGSLYLPLR